MWSCTLTAKPRLETNHCWWSAYCLANESHRIDTRLTGPLRYLQREERDLFFERLGSLVSRPTLVVVIKGVGEAQRPSPTAVRTVHFGVHYVVGQDRSPRVVEAHLCLVLPVHKTGAAPSASKASVSTTGCATAVARAAPAMRAWVGSPISSPRPPAERIANTLGQNSTSGYVHDDGGTWALQTFGALERRVKQGGVRTGVTMFREAMVGAARFA